MSEVRNAVCPACGAHSMPLDTEGRGAWFALHGRCEVRGAWTYPHMCRDGHVEIGFKESEIETCPLCVVREEIEGLRDGDSVRSDATTEASLRSAVLLAANDIRASIKLWEERDRSGHGPWDARITRLHDVLRRAEPDAPISPATGAPSNSED